MPKLTSHRVFRFALRASTALALTAAPYHLSLGSLAKIGPAGAYAKSEGGSGGGDGHGGNSGSGGGSSGSSGGNSGPGGGDDGGNSGRGGGDDDAGDDHGGQEHVNPATGDKIEIAGNNIEVTHPDGTKEEIENGRFEMKDATGRTVVERPATPEDIARLQGL